MKRSILLLSLALGGLTGCASYSVGTPSGEPLSGPRLVAVEWGTADLVVIDPDTGEGQRIGTLDDTLFGLSSRQNSLFGYGNALVDLVQIDPATAAFVGRTDLPYASSGEGAVAIHPTSGIGYSVSDEVLRGFRLDGSWVKDIGHVGDIDGLTFNSSGATLYALTQSTMLLCTLDPATRELSEIGPTGMTPSRTAGLAFVGDTLYAVASAELYTLSLSTGAASLVGPIGVGEQYSGLAHIWLPRLLFSLDIGSDMEVSDWVSVAPEENLDPGDLYESNPVAGTIHTGPWLDDRAIFGEDPLPTSESGPLVAEDGEEELPTPEELFDLDAFDSLSFSLARASFSFPLLREGSRLTSADDLIEPASVLLSFHDDDDLRSWREGPPEDRIPTESGPDMGRPGKLYELMLVGLSGALNRPYRDEPGVHADLQATGWTGRADDDDVDAVDLQSADTGHDYFSADDEGTYGLNPGSIYEVVGGAPVEVVTTKMLGLSSSADLDAFEFCWIKLPPAAGYGRSAGQLAFAVLFSTGEDKPLGPESSGGVDPTSVHVSFLDGRHHLLLRGDLWAEGNVDAIGVAPWNLQAVPVPSGPPFDVEFHDGLIPGALLTPVD